VTGVEPFAGWDADGITLVERAIAAHGGRSLWRETGCIRLPFNRAAGALLRLKGYGQTFPAPGGFEIRPHDRVTIFHRYPDDRHRGTFADGTVSIEDVEGRETSSRSIDHRRTFAGLAKYRRWSPPDALYFFGYALWHYHVLPFTLDEARLVRVLKRRGIPDGIDVVFPPDVHTHSRRQQFYFGTDGRIVRHDYVADIVGAWACASHLWLNYEACGGLLIARRRRVVFRIGRQPIPFRLLDVHFGEPQTSPSS
jgi:hypothetical protein